MLMSKNPKSENLGAALFGKYYLEPHEKELFDYIRLSKILT
jgi:hypothetical protein